MLVQATLAVAQCSNIAGNPPPVNNPLLVQKVSLNDGPGVGWGGGNERYKFAKGVITLATPFDPAFHFFTVTYHVNTVGGALIGATTVLAGDPLWTQPSPGHFVYNDNATPWPFGVQRIDIRDLGAGQYLIKMVKGRDALLNNMPLGPADDLHVMVEINDAVGIGDCNDTVLTNCNGAGTTCRF